MNKEIIPIMANSGGVGKTSACVNVAYQLAKRGKTVAILGCDPNGSLTLFSGLDDPKPGQTMDAVLSSDFDGNYPLFPVWRERIKGIDAILGGLPLIDASQRMVLDKRGSYLLADAFEDYPLPHDVILIDCPGTIEQLHIAALAASTKILITLVPEDKDLDAAGKLLEWISTTRAELRLKPVPQVMGILPNKFNKKWAMHKDNLSSEGLPKMAAMLRIKVYPAINHNAYVANASAAGLPLGLFRPGEKTNEIYGAIAQDIITGG